MAGVLEGIRVLDFGRYIAGPFCGTMLGDLGAEVIRIEKLEGSEDRWVTPVSEAGDGAMFLQMGRNKLGMTLNPMKPAGREVVKKLIAVADVVIANLPYEDLKKMGIDYDTISAINPRVILATNSTFGSEGPYATRVGFDTIGQAMSGAMHLSGDGNVPTRANAPYVDFGSALLSTVGVLAALMDRAKTGKGQKVETALLRTAMNITNSHLIEQTMLNLNRVATLNRASRARSRTAPSRSAGCARSCRSGSIAAPGAATPGRDRPRATRAARSRTRARPRAPRCTGRARARTGWTASAAVARRPRSPRAATALAAARRRTAACRAPRDSDDRLRLSSFIAVYPSTSAWCSLK